MEFRKPKNIIFIGSLSSITPLLKYFAKENVTESVSSLSFLETLVSRFKPHLLVFDGISCTQLEEVRKIEQLVSVPVLIVSHESKDASDFSSLYNFQNVLICNEACVLNEKFLGNLNQLLSAKKQMLPPKTGTIIKKVINFIDNNSYERITRKEIAESAGINEDYLSRIFSKEMGLSITEYITEIRLLKAKNLLLVTGDSAKEISRKCGFSDDAYFSNVFRKKFGTSPLGIRNKS